MQQTVFCPWCGGPLPNGYHHCRDCHRRQLLAKGLSADIDEEIKEERGIEGRQKWLSLKESGGYLTINEICDELQRSKRWVWQILRGIRPYIFLDGFSNIFGHPDGSAIINSKYGTLISHRLIPVFRYYTQDKKVHISGSKYLSSHLASNQYNYSRRWINKLVKSGKVPGYSEAGRVWVDIRKLHDYLGVKPSLPDDLVLCQCI